MPQVRPIDGLFDVLKMAKKRTAMFYNWHELRNLCRPGSLTYEYFLQGHQLGWEETTVPLTDALIEHLKGKYPLAVNSNKQDEFVKALVAQLFPVGTFVAAEGFRTDRAPKPDPAVPLMLARMMGAEPHECAYIGDSDVDVKTARNAGMRALDVCWGYRPADVLYHMGAEKVAQTPAELLELIENC
jgi:phosphoglycolate phosphatase